VLSFLRPAPLCSPLPAVHAEAAKAKADIILVNRDDQRAARNVNNVLMLYQMMINENKAEEGTARFLVSGYIQHNPLIADGAAALGKYFASVKSAHPSAHSAPWVGPNIPRANPNSMF
jgi:hypothetical protein